jgi:hypothetical protein
MPGPSRRITDRLSEADLVAMVADFQAGDPAWRLAERYGIGQTSIVRERQARRRGGQD